MAYASGAVAVVFVFAVAGRDMRALKRRHEGRVPIQEMLFTLVPILGVVVLALAAMSR